MARVALACAVLLSLVASGAAVAVPSPIVETGFLTPSGNIACNAGRNNGRKLLTCTVFSQASHKQGNKVWSMFTQGPVQVGYIMGDPATEYPKLAYGRTWSWHGIRCLSERRGLTCRNSSGHGYFLSRGSQRVF